MSMCHLPQEWTKLERPERTPWPVERASHAATCLNYREEHPQLLVTGGIDKDGNIHKHLSSSTSSITSSL